MATRKPKPKPKPKPVPYRGYMTPLDMRRESLKYARDLLSAETAPIATERQRIADEAARLASLEEAKGQALALGLRGNAGAVKDLYTGAGQAIGSLAGGFSDAMRGDAAKQGAELASLLQGSGQTARDQGAAMGDVTYGTGGFIPGRSLAEQAAAFGSAEAARPDNANLLGLAAAQEQRRKGTDALSDLAAKLDEIQAKAPSYADQALQGIRGYQNDLASQANAEHATRIQQGYLMLQNAKTAQDEAQALTQMTGTIHVVGKNGQVVDTGRIAPGSDAYANTVTATAKSGKGRTDAIAKRNDATANALADMNQWVLSLKEGGIQGNVTVGYKPVKIGTKNVPGFGSRPIYRTKSGGTTTNINDPDILQQPIYDERARKANYQFAFQHVYSQLRAQLGRRFGYSDRQLRQMADRLLASAGISKPKAKAPNRLRNYPR